ncbi:MAG: Asp-tRNA(Asn)/Glu-tRNA(Gln) amidotransferase subunit GatB [Elusimicrobia bacterium]|nr:Asp-tRNA(Asn)/Glu-tRNA(Gln) amidotransferase subunit GatB [Elusimicrobiota bacterium]
MSDLQPVIGLEIHLQLKTKTKMFCACASGEQEASANSLICPVCTSQPGALPVINEKAVELGAKAALAINCNIEPYSIFARKNYFYPDLPKSYQISQFEKPLAQNGHIKIETPDGEKKIGIERAHLEEDAGKSLHAIGSKDLDYTLIDLNRAGIPLLEIVSAPDMNSPEEAYTYLAELKKTIQWLGVSNCDMEKGELRCDVNISLKPKEATELGKKVEIKNLNSFKAVKDSIFYEIARQTDIIKSGKIVLSDTRLWDDKEEETYSMRSKETANDYRYFPDPDLVSLKFSDEYASKIKNSLGELPQQKKTRFIEQYALNNYDANLLTANKNLSSYFEDCVKLGGEPKISANLIATELMGRLNADKLEIKDCPITPQYIAELAQLLKSGKISNTISKQVMDKIWEKPSSPKELIETSGMSQVSDENQIREWAKEALSKNPKAIEDFKNGNEKAIGPIMGMIMKKSKGKANPKITNSIIKALIQRLGDKSKS